MMPPPRAINTSSGACAVALTNQTYTFCSDLFVCSVQASHLITEQHLSRNRYECLSMQCHLLQLIQPQSGLCHVYELASPLQRLCMRCHLLNAIRRHVMRRGQILHCMKQPKQAMLIG